MNRLLLPAIVLLATATTLPMQQDVISLKKILQGANPEAQEILKKIESIDEKRDIIQQKISKVYGEEEIIEAIILSKITTNVNPIYITIFTNHYRTICSALITLEKSIDKAEQKILQNKNDTTNSENEVKTFKFVSFEEKELERNKHYYLLYQEALKTLLETKDVTLCKEKLDEIDTLKQEYYNKINPDGLSCLEYFKKKKKEFDIQLELIMRKNDSK